MYNKLSFHYKRTIEFLIHICSHVRYIINNDLIYTGIHLNFTFLRYDYVINISTCWSPNLRVELLRNPRVEAITDLTLPPLRKLEIVPCIGEFEIINLIVV